MTWWAWVLVGWAALAVAIALLVGTTARRTGDIEWTQPAPVRRRRALAPAVEESTAA